MVAKLLVWTMVVLTGGTKRTRQSTERRVDVKLQIKGSECDLEAILEQHPVCT